MTGVAGRSKVVLQSQALLITDQRAAGNCSKPNQRKQRSLEVDRILRIRSQSQALLKTGKSAQVDFEFEAKNRMLDRVFKNMSESHSSLITDQRATSESQDELVVKFFNNIQPISVGV